MTGITWPKIEWSWRRSTANFWHASPLLMTVIVLAVWRLGLAVFLPYDRFIALFDDDAFYYFGIARNISEGKGSTFNGLDLTNGYHPAWLAVIEPVFLLFHGRTVFIGVTIVSCLLFIVFGVILEQYSRIVGDPRSVLIAASPILALSVVGPSYFFAGMETGLVILAVSTAGLFFLRTAGLSADSATWRNAGILGLIMTFSIAARLDSAIIMVLLGVLALYRWRDRLRVVLLAGSIPAAFLASYMLINFAIFRTFTPVSGQAKAAGDATNIEVLEQFVAAPRVFGFNLFFGLATVPIAVASLIVASRKGGRSYVDSATFAAIVYFGSLCTVIYYGLTSSWRLWPWYFYSIPLALLFSLVVLIGNCCRDRAVSIISILSIASVLSLMLVWTLDQVLSSDSRQAFVSAAPEVADMIDEINPTDSPIAVGDRAGSLGYHLHRPTVQLEGLVNSKEYLDAIEAGRVNSFLNNRGVRLYARADSEDGERPYDLDGVRRFTEPQQGNGPKTVIYVRDDDLLLTFPLPDGTSYRVWRFRSDLNSG